VAAVTGITPAADLQRAQLAVVAARNKLAQAQSSGAGLAATLADQAALDSAIYSLNQQVQSNAQQTQSDAQGLISSGLALEQSQTLDPVLQATEAVTAAANFLKTIKPSAYKTTAGYLAAKQNAEADLNNKRLAVTAAMISQDTATAQYELDTQQISSQQYIDSLTRLLAIKKMTLSQRQQLEEDIFNANQAGAVNLNVGNIKLPTSYEVRRALEKAHHGESSAQGGVVATVTNHNVWNFNIHRTADSGKVVQAIGKAAQVNTKSAMKAAGVF
jgi:hypothetical protein